MPAVLGTIIAAIGIGFPILARALHLGKDAGEIAIGLVVIAPWAIAAAGVVDVAMFVAGIDPGSILVAAAAQAVLLGIWAWSFADAVMLLSATRSPVIETSYAYGWPILSPALAGALVASLG